MHQFLAQTCIAQSQLPADHCTVWSGKEVLTNSAPCRDCCGRSPLDLHICCYHQQASHLLQCNFLWKCNIPEDNLMCMLALINISVILYSPSILKVLAAHPQAR